MKKYILVLLLALPILFCYGCTQASSGGGGGGTTPTTHILTQQCTENTYISSQYPTSTLFADDVGTLGCLTATITPGTWDAFFYFSLSSLNESSVSGLATIPSTATIESATLLLYVTGYTAQLGTALCTASWNETTLTYNNAQGLRSSTEITDTTIPGPGMGSYNWVSIDVTNAVKAWVSGSSPNYGITVYPKDMSQPGDFRKYLNYRTLRYSSSGYRPYIEIKATY